MKDDAWIRANSELDPDVLHALGVIGLRWNSCEFGLKMLFSLATNIGYPNALLITQDMGSVSISNIIRGTKELPKRFPKNVDDVFFALDLFEINRLNRNQLTHYLPAGNQSGETEFRRNKILGGIGGELIPNSVSDVRRVAEEIRALRSYLAQLHNHLTNLHYTAVYPLPERPPLPERLLKPPPPDQPKPKPRQKPSVG
jgi:hypothetical protein